MKKIKIGDKVYRNSYEKDIIFEVKKIIRKNDGHNLAILKGITERIEVDSDIEDLELADKTKVNNSLRKLDLKFEEKTKDFEFYNKQTREENGITGRILHLDGDRKYSEKSYKYYKRIGLRAIVKNVPEYKQPKVVYNLLLHYNPDILVITGHDGMIKKGREFNDIFNYRNSKYFVETVKEARRYEREEEKEIVIFAGACQSYFEALIMAGANFASSPARILIDFLDPIIIAKKVATTDYLKYITIGDVKDELRDGNKGVGGIGANGKKKYYRNITKM